MLVEHVPKFILVIEILKSEKLAAATKPVVSIGANRAPWGHHRNG